MGGALFLDRDGVINQMVFYNELGQYDSPQNLEDVKLVDGITEVISWANKHKILVIEVSNQPGVAKGKMSQDLSDAIEDKVHELLRTRNAKIIASYICPHHPGGIIPELTVDCQCRKPKSGLISRASLELAIDLIQSVVIGDSATDMEAGKSVGCKTILLLSPENSPEKVQSAREAASDYTIHSLDKVIPILEQILPGFKP